MESSCPFPAAGSERVTISSAAPRANKESKVPVGACAEQDADIVFAGWEKRTVGLVGCADVDVAALLEESTWA